MNLPGVPPDFQFPEDPGELLAWMKNFATKLPGYAEKLGVSVEDLAIVQSTYEQMRAAKAAEDEVRLRVVERDLCKVPDAWPPPATLHDLIRKIPAIEEPERTRMLKEIERWSGAIVRAGSPRPVPTLSGEYFDRGIVLRLTLPERCRWGRFYYRPAGEGAWRLLAITGQDYTLNTDPESQKDEKEKLEGNVEFVVIGVLAHEDPQVGFGDAWGAPSEVLTMTVPKEYPVPAAQRGAEFQGPR
ncbi:MAG TPA: hypothetical protein VEO95_03895 [Chthoniobacteraceae bacterium]|nr:hypothetical protein [Chthoniobacteraceae bacterium]